MSTIDEAYDIPEIGKVGLVVNATGLGSASLIGVEDSKVYPARGQTVLVKAPLVDRCIMSVDGFMAKDGKAGVGGTAYLIPRPGPEGHVVLGGTYIAGNFSSLPDLDEAERIMRACYELEPLLAHGGKSWKDIQVISHNVGLRPAREGGARIQLEKRILNHHAGDRAALSPCTSKQRSVALVHAYGFGSTG